MAERPDLPRIKPHKAPSLINREMTEYAWTGGVLGSLVGVFSKGKGLAAVLGSVAVGQLIGGTIGALKGKAREEREMVEGRVVKDPSIWNGGFFTGAVIAEWMTLGGTTFMGTPGRPAANFLTHAVAITSPVIGMFLRKNEMQRDFDEAVAIRHQEIGAMKEHIRALESTAAPKHGPFMNSVNADEMATLATKQEARPVHAEQLAAQAEAPEPARGA